MFACASIFHLYRCKVLKCSKKYQNLSFRDRISRTRTANIHRNYCTIYTCRYMYKHTSKCTTNTMYLVLFSVEKKKCIDQRICCTLYFPQNFPTRHLRTAMRNSTRIFTRTIHRLSLYTKLRATQYIKILSNNTPNKRLKRIFSYFLFSLRLHSP